MRERMLAGDLYLADDPELLEQNLRAMDLMEAFNATPMREAARRRSLLVELLGALGDETEIRPPVRVDYGRHIRIGARTFLNFGLVALDVAPITIGDDVQIGTNVQLLTPTHPLDPAQRRAKCESAAPITIADNVWPGSGAIVLPGVTIGENTVVGAGSVVTGDLTPNAVSVGNPARVVRTLTPFDTIWVSPAGRLSARGPYGRYARLSSTRSPSPNGPGRNASAISSPELDRPPSGTGHRRCVGGISGRRAEFSKRERPRQRAARRAAPTARLAMAQRCTSEGPS